MDDSTNPPDLPVYAGPSERVRNLFGCLPLFVSGLAFILLVVSLNNLSEFIDILRFGPSSSWHIYDIPSRVPSGPLEITLTVLFILFVGGPPIRALALNLYAPTHYPFDAQAIKPRIRLGLALMAITALSQIAFRYLETAPRSTQIALILYYSGGSMVWQILIVWGLLTETQYSPFLPQKQREKLKKKKKNTSSTSPSG